jgi:hypothetical protein
VKRANRKTIKEAVSARFPVREWLDMGVGTQQGPLYTGVAGGIPASEKHLLHLVVIIAKIGGGSTVIPEQSCHVLPELSQCSPEVG